MSKTVAYKGYAAATRRFDIEPSPGRQRNSFTGIYRRYDTFNAGELVPFLRIPALPGDDFILNPRFLIRLSNSLISPLMDEIIVNYYFFKTYNRFVFEDWNAFMGEHVQSDPDYDESGENKGGQSLTEPPFNSPTQYELPTMIVKSSDGTTAPFAPGSLLDHFALPYKVLNDGYEIHTLPLRHYNLIFNEYFRNENLQDFAPVPKSIGPDKLTQYQLMPVNKYADYFTGSLPFLQKGPNVSIGLTGDVPVLIPSGTENCVLPLADVSNPKAYRNAHLFVNGSTNAITSGPGVSSNDTHLRADLGAATAVQLSQIRLAFQLQRFYEGQARSGTRYIEYVHFMFNEYIPDVQLQRPEYVGGGKFYININPVAQTSNSVDETSPLGTLAAFGVAYHSDPSRITCHFQEHGYLLGLLCVRTNLSYQQGLHRDWSYRDRLDFYTPTLAHLSEQPILNKEVCCTGISDYDNDVFGYIGRYDEYRTQLTEICGYFRSNVDYPLDTYHLGEFFDTSSPGTSEANYPGLPHLNAKFVVQPSNVIDRALNLPSKKLPVPQFLMNFSAPLRYTSCLSKYGIPGFADHF